MMFTGALPATSIESSPKLATSPLTTTLRSLLANLNSRQELSTQTHQLKMKTTRISNTVTTPSTERTGSVVPPKTWKLNISLATLVTSPRLTVRTCMANPSLRNLVFLSIKSTQLVLCPQLTISTRQRPKLNTVRASSATSRIRNHLPSLRISAMQESSTMPSKFAFLGLFDCRF